MLFVVQLRGLVTRKLLLQPSAGISAFEHSNSSTLQQREEQFQVWPTHTRDKVTQAILHKICDTYHKIALCRVRLGSAER